MLAKVIGIADLRSVGYRLGYWIPMCSWPPFLWIQSQGEYNWSLRHSAEPLYSVGNEALIIVLLLAIIGATLHALCAKDWEHRGYGFLFCVLHLWIIWSWITENAVAYA